MTVHRWLNLAAIVVAALALFVAVAAWRALPGRDFSPDEIRARTAAEIDRIVARAAEMERNASQ